MKSHQFIRLLVAAALAGLFGQVSAQNLPGLMRFPDVHDKTVAFVCGEDIWTAPLSGGVATRITINDGEERYPRFSPDGSLIAFTGEYDGNDDVYVMNVHGGNITRLTYHPSRDEVVGWHLQKNKVIFASTRSSYQRFERLFMVSPKGTEMEAIEIHEAAQGSFSPDGKQIAYNKIGREDRTWKRYRGGSAQDLYLYDFTTQKNRQLTDFSGTDRIPMWVGNKIYFSSDRNGVLNIYAYDTQTETMAQVTRHANYDVRRPASDGKTIVYELGGDLWALDISSGQSGQIPIDIRTDIPQARPMLKSVDRYITGINLSPSGKRALIVARGELFSVPRENGPTMNLTATSGAREKDAVWSPDRTTIAFFSDENGEYNLYLLDAAGEKAAVRITDFKEGYRHALKWSPDSKKLSFTDQTLRLHVLDVATRKLTEVDRALYENVDVSLDRKPISDYAWSPDSRYIAYSMMNADLVYQILIYELATAKKHLVSDGIFNDFNPVFTPDGEHLLFVSNRRFDPVFCDFEWEMVYKKMAGIYSLTLRRDGPPLLPFQNDQETPGEAGPSPKPDKKAGALSPKAIDFDGISGRVEALPLPQGNYRELSVNDAAVFYLNAAAGDFNRFEFRAIGPRNLYTFSWKDREEKTVIENIDAYRFSADGNAIVYRQQDKVGIIDSSECEAMGSPLLLSGLTMWLDPSAEWRQMFVESWRMERDFYYEPNMQGLNWVAMKMKYGKMLDRASCRQDVRYVIGELIGELNTSHTYIYGGDLNRKADPVNVGMLGVDWQVDPDSRRYRFKKIYRVAEWTDAVMPPLALPGATVLEGDYLLSVNGHAVDASRNIYSYFQNLAGEEVTLKVNSRPVAAGARTVTVKPLRSEFQLRYLDWLEHNRKVVEAASGGTIGYLHLPDTYTGSAKIFPKYFYSQTRKKGLIVDGRFNGGGLDPDIFLQRLDKQLHSYWTRRYSHDQTTPAVVTRAHQVCLTNRQAGSGGDMLPMEFKLRNMGPVIGTRTWGGLVGVSMFIDLIDGGGLTAPDYRIYGTDGRWVVENEGVQPDIVVDLDPAEMNRGFDVQLMKGVEVLLEKIKADPRPWPKHGPFPVDREVASE